MIPILFSGKPLNTSHLCLTPCFYKFKGTWPIHIDILKNTREMFNSLTYNIQDRHWLEKEKAVDGHLHTLN